MIRHAAAIIIVLLLTPSWLTAQSGEMTIAVTSAEVHKAPATTSPIIGHAGRGAQLHVTRNVGDWVKIAWPAAPDGVGYVRVSLGSVSTGTVTTTPIASETAPAPTAAVQASPRATASAQVVPTDQNRLPVRNPQPTPATTHVFGIGARLGGPAMGLGFGARGWAHGRLGVQFEMSRYDVSSPIDLGTMSSTDISPSVMYAFNDHVADYTWLRPYVGGGLNFYHSSINSPVLGTDVSDSRMGSQVFGGSELSFASVPQFAISTEISYRWFNAPSAGYDLGGIGVSVGGHWYVK